MYSRILSLNHTELGYLVKQFESEELSNLIQSEGKDKTSLFEIIFKTFKNFIKIVTKKLDFKIHAVYYRNMKAISPLVYEKLAFEFPKI